MIIGGGCNNKATCKNGMDAEDSGPAAEMIWDSFVYLHEMFMAFDWTLYKAATRISFSLDDFGNKFAPIPEEEDNTWLLVLIDLVTLEPPPLLGPFSTRSSRSSHTLPPTPPLTTISRIQP
jgi:hypothetical protein